MAEVISMQPVSRGRVQACSKHLHRNSTPLSHHARDLASSHSLAPGRRLSSQCCSGVVQVAPATPGCDPASPGCTSGASLPADIAAASLRCDLQRRAAASIIARENGDQTGRV